MKKIHLTELIILLFQHLLGIPTNIISKSDIKSMFYTLEQNYPNPFNPSTTIHYSLPNSSAEGEKQQTKNVKLIVYDVLGREIAVLVDEKQKPGKYEVEFNPSADRVELTSGIYFYRLRTGDFAETKKMVLVK